MVRGHFSLSCSDSYIVKFTPYLVVVITSLRKLYCDNRPGSFFTDMLVAIAINPDRTACLTRRNDDLFVWSERTIKELDETKGAI